MDRFYDCFDCGKIFALRARAQWCPSCEGMNGAVIDTSNIVEPAAAPQQQKDRLLAEPVA